MVAKIKSGKSLTGALNYNENKVKKGSAQMIGANGFAKDPEHLSFYDKLFRLTDLASRNQLTRTNSLHISLNFDPAEKLEMNQLNSIADSYMGRMGFGDQPYLVYQHTDAGHPHIHIVSTNIRPNGERISLHNIGKEKSEPARKAIELEYGLIRAESKKESAELKQPAAIVPLQYGQEETKKALGKIVNQGVQSYKFTSLPEFNAILNGFNILADRGGKESVMFRHGGIRYWITDDKGQKLGVPIKASSLFKKPTLKLLEDRFKLNQYLRKPYREPLKKKIDQALAGSNSLTRLRKQLKHHDIDLLIRMNTEGRVYGLTFIDGLNKVIFNGSDLGKNYGANTLLQRFENVGTNTEQAFVPIKPHLSKEGFVPAISGSDFRNGLLEELLHSADVAPGVPFPFKKKKKRKKLNL